MQPKSSYLKNVEPVHDQERVSDCIEGNACEIRERFEDDDKQAEEQSWKGENQTADEDREVQDLPDEIDEARQQIFKRDKDHCELVLCSLRYWWMVSIHHIN